MFYRRSVALLTNKVDERQIFPFMQLPLELRMMIYQQTFDYDGIESYFESYVDQIMLSSRPRKVKAPRCEKACPGILLVNKEIYHEALPYLHATPIDFSYGVIKAKLVDIISPDLLRNISHVTITDTGLDLLNKDYLDIFHGISRLIHQLATVLKDGHKIQVLKFQFLANDFNFHLKNCPHSSQDCGVKSFVATLQDTIGNIRGIKKVTIEGDLDDELKSTIIARMESKPQNLFKLPLSIREQIYAYAADPNDADLALTSFMRTMATGQTPAYPTLSAPTILLLNKQIHSEAHSIMRRIPLLLSGRTAATHNPATVFKFIRPQVLQQLYHLELDLRHWQYTFLLGELSALLKRRHCLRSLSLRFADEPAKAAAWADGAYYPDDDLYRALLPLAALRGIRDVEIVGSLPDCFAQPLAMSMMCRPGERSHTLFAQLPHGRGFVRFIEVQGSEMCPIEVD